MFDAHPPFQIDGNFGGCSGIMQMLLQSRGVAIELLPGLPKEWPSCSIKGLHSRGGFEVDVVWGNWNLTEAKIRRLNGNPFQMCYKGKTRTLDLKSIVTSTISGV